MWVWLDRLAPLLLDASLASTVLTSLFLAILLVCMQPARRIALARTAILGVLAIGPLTAFAPWPHYQIVHTLKRSGLTPRQVFARRASKSSAKQTQKSGLDGSATVPIGVRMGPPPTGAPIGHLALRVVRLVVLAYIVVVAFGLARVALESTGAWWLIRSSDPPSPRTQRIFDSLLDEPGRDARPWRRPRLRISKRVAGPAVVALLRPTILLPVDFDRAGRDASDGSDPTADGLLRLSLLHELAHAGRHDASFRLVGSVAQAIWFFLPQLWWIRSRLRLDQEFLADHVASRAYGTSSQYATSLLELAASRLPSPPAPPEPSSRVPADRDGSIVRADVPSSLGQRLLMLLHCPFRLEASAPRGWLWSLRIVGLAATVALADVSVRLPGLGYGSPPSPTSEANFLAKEDPFRVSELIVGPPSETPAGQSPAPYTLPYELPDHFSMTVDVLASSARLGHIRLMHLPLDQPETRATPFKRLDDASTMTPPVDTRTDRVAWHHVRIDRDDRGVSLSVDQSTLPCPADLTDSWITVEPASGDAVELRDLIVTPTP